MRRSLSILGILLLLAWQAAAQVSTASIGGRVVDGRGPVEGVTVVAVHQQTNAQYYAVTGQGGWYQLLDVLPGGPYTLRISYFGYDPLTARNVYTYAGQHTVVDADLEERTCHLRIDEASTSVRVGEGLVGGYTPVAPTGYEFLSQQIYTDIPFDVRREASLSGAEPLRVIRSGGRTLRTSAYGFYGHGDEAGLTFSAPLTNDDCQLFAGLRYNGPDGLGGAGRFDARLNQAMHFDAQAGWLSASDRWASAALTARLSDGRASNRTQAGWYDDASGREWLLTDDFTLAAGRHRLLFGGQLAYGSVPLSGFELDSSFTRFDVYLQDAVRLGRRLSLLAGARFSFPFAFSPRLSLCFDVTGTGAVVLRAGTAVYGRHDEGSVWRNLIAIDTRLPLDFRLTLEASGGRSLRRLFYISTNNLIYRRYDLTARLERPFSDNLWAVASYTRSSGVVRNHFIGGFSYRASWLEDYATTLSLLYSQEKTKALEARLSQDLHITALGRIHAFQLTGYLRRAPGTTSVLVGLRYYL